MKTIIKILILCVSAMGIWGCGDTGGMEESADTPSVETPKFTYSSAEDLQTPFYCSGGTVSFEIAHTGTCAYRFDVINKDTQNLQANLATGAGEINVQFNIPLAKGDYYMDAETACTWTIKVYGPVAQYASYVLCDNYPDVPSSTTCTDHGGASGVLGCDRVSGYFICADGTISDTVCTCP